MVLYRFWRLDDRSLCSRPSGDVETFVASKSRDPLGRGRGSMICLCRVFMGGIGLEPEVKVLRGSVRVAWLPGCGRCSLGAMVFGG